MATERKIGREIYRCEELPAIEALALFDRMSSVIDAEVLDVFKSGANETKICEEYLALAMSPNIDTEKLNALMKEMAEMCTVSGEPAIVGHKPNTMREAIVVAFFALEVQFRDFLSVALAAATSGPKSGAA